MPFYIKRDEQNRIISIANAPVPNAEKVDSLQISEILAFLGHDSNSVYKELFETDWAMIRVIDDIIAILLDKNVLNITDFSPQIMDKLIKRKSIRLRLQSMTGMNSEEK